MSNVDKLYMSVEETATMLGIPPSTVRLYARTGQLPGRKLGHNWLFKINEVHAAITKGLDDTPRDDIPMTVGTGTL